jgi:threonine dehydrogenase-like Zn-dependent dehydrogenase
LGSPREPGDTVAVLGVGGLGHLGVQFAPKMGFRTVAIARGADKEALAQKLDAQYYSSIVGWPSGTSTDSEAALAFSQTPARPRRRSCSMWASRLKLSAALLAELVTTFQAARPW